MHKIDRASLMSIALTCSALDIEPARTLFWYTLRELMLHEAFYVKYVKENAAIEMLAIRTTMLFGSAILSAHVPGQPEVAYELPAQSPQKVMSGEKEKERKNSQRRIGKHFQRD